MKASELRDKDLKGLEDELLEQHKAQFNLRMQKATGQLARPDQMTQVRREIARIKTVINEKIKAGETS
ncbi:50S ribosomal protein L29 [Spiribacter salinus M19-40]|jgi:large subunit ribosomal protein L29|uniref:Large ribosomal subunit protein uL29 n=1 Tax=Spiribacter salinus M19-40 TaxID=1260251 RepID=R4VHB8_9GAMM|nr:50S ribosomal protein L29 [Spiribacter salinus]AGM41581.1 50S ribosomal protein L29 [Spiribacter salinus M19-40]MBY5269171.1 50S ribosomal protein L29 [Spiribacter salinus]MDR9414151.1 50S ribosomal protein L29 [Spiribacter sp.]MDR9454585.1 50S ribosomal protein L29 [Spiribacter sp.]